MPPPLYRSTSTPIQSIKANLLSKHKTERIRLDIPESEQSVRRGSEGERGRLRKDEGGAVAYEDAVGRAAEAGGIAPVDIFADIAVALSHDDHVGPSTPDSINQPVSSVHPSRSPSPSPLSSPAFSTTPLPSPGPSPGPSSRSSRARTPRSRAPSLSSRRANSPRARTPGLSSRNGQQRSMLGRSPRAPAATTRSLSTLSPPGPLDANARAPPSLSISLPSVTKVHTSRADRRADDDREDDRNNDEGVGDGADGDDDDSSRPTTPPRSHHRHGRGRRSRRDKERERRRDEREREREQPRSSRRDRDKERRRHRRRRHASRSSSPTRDLLRSYTASDILRGIALDGGATEEEAQGYVSPPLSPHPLLTTSPRQTSDSSPRRGTSPGPSRPAAQRTQSERLERKTLFSFASGRDRDRGLQRGSAGTTPTVVKATAATASNERPTGRPIMPRRGRSGAIVIVPGALDAAREREREADAAAEAAAAAGESGSRVVSRRGSRRRSRGDSFAMLQAGRPDARPAWWLPVAEDGTASPPSSDGESGRGAGSGLRQPGSEMTRVVAIADHTPGAASTDLHFHCGESFVVVARPTRRYWTAQHKGRIARVPSAKLRIVGEQGGAAAPRGIERRPSHLDYFRVKALADHPPPGTSPVGLLPFKCGESFAVLEMLSDETWKGSHKGKVGKFPADAVVELDDGGAERPYDSVQFSARGAQLSARRHLTASQSVGSIVPPTLHSSDEES